MGTANKPKDPKKETARATRDPNTPVYRAEAKHYVDGKRYEIGEEVPYNGIPGMHLAPLNDAAKKAVRARDAAKTGKVAVDVAVDVTVDGKTETVSTESTTAAAASAGKKA